MICITSTRQLRSDRNLSVAPTAGELKAEKQDTYRKGDFRFWNEFKQITPQSFRGVNDPCLASDCRGETHSACYQNWIALNMRESLSEDCLDPNGMPYGESYEWDDIRPKFDERTAAGIDGRLFDKDNPFLDRTVSEVAFSADYSCKSCTDCGACEDDPDTLDYIKCIDEEPNSRDDNFSFKTKPGQKVVYFEKNSGLSVVIDGGVYLYEPDFVHSADCQCEECQKLFKMVCEMTEEQIWWMMQDFVWELPTKEETDDWYEEELAYREEQKLEELAQSDYLMRELVELPKFQSNNPVALAGWYNQAEIRFSIQMARRRSYTTGKRRYINDLERKEAQKFVMNEKRQYVGEHTFQ